MDIKERKDLLFNSLGELILLFQDYHFIDIKNISKDKEYCLMVLSRIGALNFFSIHFANLLIDLFNKELNEAFYMKNDKGQDMVSGFFKPAMELIEKNISD